MQSEMLRCRQPLKITGVRHFRRHRVPPAVHRAMAERRRAVSAAPPAHFLSVLAAHFRRNVAKYLGLPLEALLRAARAPVVEWRILFTDGHFHFVGYVDGQALRVCGPFDSSEAVLMAGSVIQGCARDAFAHVD